MLPGPRSAYMNGAGWPDFGKITTTLDAQLPPDPSQRSYLVFADQMSDYGLWGQAILGPNYGRRMYAVVYNDSTPFDFEGNSGPWHPHLMLHEVTHTLGAVSDYAPFASGA